MTNIVSGAVFERSAPLTLRRVQIFGLALIALVSSVCVRAELPKIQSWKTSQGATVLFVENHALPMIDLRVDFDAGSRRDPKDKAGLAGFALGLLTDGAAGMGEADIARAQADLGAEISPFVDVDGGGLQLRTLSDADVRDKAFDLFTRILSQPDYPAAVFEREKARSLAGLKQALTQPAAVANDRFQAVLYGGHPYGRTSEDQIRALPGLTRDDLLAFYRQHVVASRAIVALVGDISRADAEKTVEKMLGSLPVDGPKLPLLAPVVFASPAAKERIAFPSSQAHVVVGLPLIARSDPDFFPLVLANHILGGGGFTSRLTKVIRDEHGLAYSVYSSFQSLLQQGPFEVGLQTRKEEADNAVRYVREVVEQFVKEGPTAAELKQAKGDLINGFALGLDSNRKWLAILGRIGRHNLPLDYLDNYAEHIQSLTAVQVRDAVRRHIDPKRMATVIVGAPEQKRVSQ